MRFASLNYAHMKARSDSARQDMLLFQSPLQRVTCVHLRGSEALIFLGANAEAGACFTSSVFRAGSCLSSRQVAESRVSCRNGVQADSKLYAVLMNVASAARQPQVARDLHSEMQASGLRPSRVSF